MTLAKKHGQPKPFKTMVKQVFSVWQKNTAAQPEHGYPGIVKNIGKQAKRAEGPRYGNNPAAAPPSRAQANL